MSGGAGNDKPGVALRRAAMNLLARREHSFHELKQKLAEKFPDCDESALIVPVLESLRQENLQSDARFIESWIHYRRSRGFGPLKIAAELHGRGLERDAVRQALDSEEHDWFGCCARAMQKRFPDTDRHSVARQQKCRRFLAQRGFTEDQIRHALQQES